MLASLFAGLLLVGMQEAPQAPPPPDAAALMAEYDALQEEMMAAFKAWSDALPRDADRHVIVSEEDRARQPTPGFLPRVLELGRRAGATEAGMKALSLALNLASADREAGPAKQKEIVELLLDRFLDSPQLEQTASILGEMRDSVGSGTVTAWLERIRDGSPHDAVRAAALLALAETLLDPGSAVHADGTPYQDRSQDNLAARAALVELQARYPATEYGAKAPGFLFELDHLQVGMVAPDVEASDQDGKTFKLSDYRGKVVLLVFWGLW